MIRLNQGWRMCFHTWRVNPVESLKWELTPPLYGYRDIFLYSREKVTMKLINYNR